MGKGNYERKLRTPTCLHCHEQFETTATSAKYCKKPECQKSKRDSWKETEQKRKKKEYRKDVPKAKEKVVRYCQAENSYTGEVCGKKLKHNFFFCDECWPLINDVGMHDTI
jgi:hypothetical protein